jgi:hypothetical protein
MIAIGAVYGEPEQKGSAIDQAISAAMRAAAKLRAPWEIGHIPGVNVVFSVPGRLTSPDWEGLRDGKFSRKQQFLMIQVAVPREMVSSVETEDFIVESLHKANALALKVFHKKGIEFPLAQAHALVGRIENELKEGDC